MKKDRLRRARGAAADTIIAITGKYVNPLGWGRKMRLYRI